MDGDALYRQVAKVNGQLSLPDAFLPRPFLTADEAAECRRVLGVRTVEDVRRERAAREAEGCQLRLPDELLPVAVGEMFP